MSIVHCLCNSFLTTTLVQMADDDGGRNLAKERQEAILADFKAMAKNNQGGKDNCGVDDDESATGVGASSKTKPMRRIVVRSRTDGPFVIDDDIIDPRNPVLSTIYNGAKIRTQLVAAAHKRFDKSFDELGTLSMITNRLDERLHVAFVASQTNPDPVSHFTRVLVDNEIIRECDGDDWFRDLRALVAGRPCFPIDALLKNNIFTGKIQLLVNSTEIFPHDPARQEAQLRRAIEAYANVGFCEADITDALQLLNVSPIVMKRIVTKAQLVCDDAWLWSRPQFLEDLTSAFKPFEREALLDTLDGILDSCTVPSNLISVSVVCASASALIMLPHRAEEAKRAIFDMQSIPNSANYIQQRYTAEMLMTTALSGIFNPSTAKTGLAGVKFGEIVPDLDTELVRGAKSGTSPIRMVIGGACGSHKTQKTRKAVADLVTATLEENALLPPDKWTALHIIGTAQNRLFALTLQEELMTAARESCAAFFGRFQNNAAPRPGNAPDDAWEHFETKHKPASRKYKDVRRLSNAKVNAASRTTECEIIRATMILVVSSCAHSEPGVNEELNKIAQRNTRVVIFRDEVAAALERIPGGARKPYIQDVVDQFHSYASPNIDNPLRHVVLEIEADATYFFIRGNPDTYLSISMRMVEDTTNRVQTYFYAGLAVGPKKCINSLTGQLDYPEFTVMFDPATTEPMLSAHRVALSLLRPDIPYDHQQNDDYDSDDDLDMLPEDSVDKPGPQPQPRPSVWLHYPASRADTTKQFAAGAITRSLVASNNVARAIIPSSLSIPICGVSSDTASKEHALSFARTAEIISCRANDVVNSVNTNEWLATSTFSHGNSVVVQNPDTVKITSCRLPASHGPHGVVQGARRIRNGEHCIALTNEYEAIPTQDAPLHSVEFAKTQAAVRHAQSMLPGGVAKVMAEASTDGDLHATSDQIASVLQAPDVDTDRVSRDRSASSAGMMTLLARLKYFRRHEVRTSFKMVINQLVLMTSFVPRHEAAPMQFLSRIVGFHTPDQKRFVEAIRGYTLMVNRVLSTNPTMADHFIMQHACIRAKIGDGVDGRTFEHYASAAAQSVQALLAYRALTFSPTSSYDNARDFAAKLMHDPCIDPSQPLDPEVAARQKFELQTINTAIDERMRRCKTGRDMTLLAVLYFELDKNPRDRELTKLVTECVALRHLYYMLEAEFHREKSHEAVTAHNTMLGLAGFIAVASCCTQFGQLDTTSVVAAIKSYSTDDDVIPCTITVCVDGQHVNLMQHAATLCEEATGNGFSRDMRSYVERIANVTLSSSHGRTKMQFTFGKAFPAGVMTRDEAIAFAVGVDNLPVRKKKTRTEVIGPAEQAAVDAVGEIDNVAALELDDSKYKLLEVSETITTSDLFEFVKEHRPEDMDFLLSEGGSFVIFDADPIQYRANIMKATADAWIQLRLLMKRCARRNINNGTGLKDIPLPNINIASAVDLEELEKFSRQMAIHVDFTVADERLAQLEILRDGGSVGEQASASERKTLQKRIKAISRNERERTKASLPPSGKRKRPATLAIPEASTPSSGKRSRCDTPESSTPRNRRYARAQSPDTAVYDQLMQSSAQVTASRPRGRPAKKTQGAASMQEGSVASSVSPHSPRPSLG
jgi:hypothetical protein